MTYTLWAIEARREGKWLLLPNLIMVDRQSAEFEMKELKKDGEVCRLVSYRRGESIHEK